MNCHRTVAIGSCVVVWGLSAPGCSRSTHAYDFSVDEPANVDLVCKVCPPAPALRHPPCPPASPGSGGGGTYFYAMYKADVGARPSEWNDQFVAGADLDCSHRPDGQPVLCSPRPEAVDVPWVALPRGIDNALGSRIWAPAATDPAIAEDLQTRVDAQTTSGRATALLIVDDWNGSDDDGFVEIRVVSGAATKALPARWDGTDEWYAVSEGSDLDKPWLPKAPLKKDGYVSGGYLVMDSRDQGLQFRLYNVQALLELNITSAFLWGKISPTQITDSSLSGLAVPSPSFARSMAEYVTGCDRVRTCQLVSKIERLVNGAPDMPLAGQPHQGACEAISVGFSLHFIAFQGVAGTIPETAIPKLCRPFPCN